MLLELILLASFILVLAWYPCCTDGVPGYANCPNCSGSGNNAPQYLTIAFSDFANDTCTECSSYDGSYVVPWYGSSSIPSSCEWRYYTEPASEICNSYYIYIRIIIYGTGTPTETKWYLYFEHGDSPGSAAQYYFEESFAVGLKDCLELTNDNVPYSSRTVTNSYYCDASSITCMISSGDTT